MTDPEQIRPLELLHRTAETIGAVICITATSDRRTPGGGRRLFTRRIGAQLSKLVVVIPLRPVEVEVPKWLRLARGTVVAQADLVEEVPLDDVALVVAEQLACRIAALRRGAA